MGIDCSKNRVRNQIEIVGNGNSAYMVSSESFNISSILEATIILTVKHYRSQLVVINAATIFLVFLFTLMIILYRKLYHQSGKGVIYK